MEAFFRTHAYLVEHTNATLRRTLMDEINWDDRMIGIKGTRGVGKTTFLLQYAKENFAKGDRQCLYINMNNFYFQSRGIADFAADFVNHGGKVLLIDQVFKQPDWSSELRKCYDRYPELKIIFTGSSVMRLKDENPELNGIVKSYNLRGFSFREYLNIITGKRFKAYSLEEIISQHENIVKEILPLVSPSQHFRDYIHHGFYPFFLEQRNFSENLLKYLADARLINMMHLVGDDFPKKPSKIMMHNPNLMYAIYPIVPNEQVVMETFFVNALWKDHLVNQSNKEHYYIVDEKRKFRICDARGTSKVRYNNDTIYARYNTEVGKDNKIPLWLFGFLY